MEVLLLIALVIVIIQLSRLSSRQKQLAEENQQNHRLIRKVLDEVKKWEQQTAFTQQPPEATAPEVVQWRPLKQPEAPAPTAKSESTAETPARSTPAAAESTPVVEPVVSSATETAATTPAYTAPEPRENWWTGWMRNNPDVEKFIGENLINKIGIAVLVLGIAFFVKYAIDQDWIKETGRVCIGIGCGIILVGIAHYLRNSYRSFSSVTAGGGIAVFYFTIAFAFHEYRMFGQTTAFVIMVVITIFAVLIALLYDKLELAVIAIIGGFLAPFLVSNGAGNYVALFSYLLVLNVGMLVIAYFKKWPLLHILAYIFTCIIFGGWLISVALQSSTTLPYRNAMLFATSFYCIFLAAVMVHNLRTAKPFKPFDFSLLLAITFSYFAAGMFILSKWDAGAYQGLFTLVLALINLALAWYLFKSQRGEKNLLYLLIGLTLTFISLAAPVQLHGHSITLFWSAEAVLLYWLFQKSSIRLFKYTSAIVVVLMLVSLMLDWANADEQSGSYLVVIFTNWQGGITNFMAIVSLGLYAKLLLNDKEGNYLPFIDNELMGQVMAIASLLIAYASCLFLVNLVFIQQQSHDIPDAYHQLITYVFIAAVIILLHRRNKGHVLMLTFACTIAAALLYISSSGYANNLFTGYLQQQYSLLHIIVHWVAFGLLLFVFERFIRVLRSSEPLPAAYTWLSCMLLSIVLSIECRLLYIFSFSLPTNISVYSLQYSRAGLTIVWALFSFALMWLGMRYKYKPLRINSLSIFSLALLKLFLFDLSNVSEGGKIAAFIMLGILLLVVSFMYQRLKKIIIDHDTKND